MISMLFARLFKATENTLTAKIRVEENQRLELQNTINAQQEKIGPLIHQANSDNLTGLNNRNAFRKALMVILNICREHSRLL